jgi:adenylosuccinate lyase
MTRVPEAALRLLTARRGKHAAQAAMQAALAGGRPLGPALREAGLLSDEEIAGLQPDTGAAGAMVDLVVARARAARDEEPPPWT